MFLARPRLAAASASAQESAGFRPLFNGKDLTGWVTPEDKSLFTVENGEIVGRTGDKPLKKNEFLVTDKSYGDFVLKAKVKIRNGNSGIQFRSERKPDGVVSGPQADVADDQWGLLVRRAPARHPAALPLEEAKKLLKPDGWNEFVITAKGTHVTIDLNGTRIIERDDPKFDKEGIIATSDPRLEGADGGALQGHRDQGTDALSLVPAPIEMMPPCRDGASCVWVQSGMANSGNRAVMRAVCSDRSNT